MFDLTPKEFYAIGEATVQWAYLEHALYFRTKALCRQGRMAIPAAATDTSFTRRLRAFREVVNAVIKLEKRQKKYLLLAARIANAEGTRHRVIHGLWEYDPKHPERLFNFNARPPFKTRFHKMNEKKISDFAIQVGALSFELDWPNGRGIFPPRMPDGPFAYVSRSFLLPPEAKALAGPVPVPAMPPEQLRQPQEILAALSKEDRSHLERAAFGPSSSRPRRKPKSGRPPGK